MPRPDPQCAIRDYCLRCCFFFFQAEDGIRDLTVTGVQTCALPISKHCGLSNKQIQSAFDTFKGIKRRMEVRGIAGGVTVVDDFGHHPTAIRETLRALRIKYPRQKIWAVFEPRSNTTRRNVFQTELVSAFANADAVVVAQVARLELLPAQERLDPARLMQDLQACGKPAAYLPDADAIVGHVAKNLQGGDVICVFSNGGFGGIHVKLLERLGGARMRCDENFWMPPEPRPP